jgi:ElaB/YqjD/DUF883 family membrane-anchored ribosome-binding protein
MAANQTSNQTHKSDNSRRQSNPSAPRQFEREESTGYGSMGEMAQQASDYVSESAEQVQECIRDRPVSSVMVSLVAGFGLGLLLGKAISMPYQQPRSRRYREMAEGFGSRLMDRIESLVPDAIAEHFGK